MCTWHVLLFTFWVALAYITLKAAWQVLDKNVPKYEESADKLTIFRFLGLDRYHDIQYVHSAPAVLLTSTAAEIWQRMSKHSQMDDKNQYYKQLVFILVSANV